MSILNASGIVGGLVNWASGLRFPWLFVITAFVFVADLLLPDLIPFADEILLGLFVGLLAALKKKRTARGQAAAPRPRELTEGGEATETERPRS